MASYPYLLTLQTTVLALTAGTLSFSVPVNEKLTIRDIRHLSTGIFNITDIRDGGSQHFTNASVNTPILNLAFQKADSPNLGLPMFAQDIVIEGGNTIYFDVIDTSNAGNTIRLYLNTIKESS